MQFPAPNVVPTARSDFDTAAKMLRTKVQEGTTIRAADAVLDALHVSFY